MRDDLIPNEATIYGWIEEVFGHGIRRPGYPADRWAEDWCQQRFRNLGLENVRAEPVQCWSWEPRETSLRVTTANDEWDIPCFALPHCAQTSVESGLVAFDPENPAAVAGSISLYDVPLNRLPDRVMRGLSTWSFDPDDSFETSVHVLPFGREIMGVMEPSIAAGAVGFVGVLRDYPGDSYEYYVPYDAVERAIPGVWIRGSDGARLREALANGPVTARLVVDAAREQIEVYNIIGELPGADDETVIIGSHHDGPWASAVEDSSGISLVLAQAQYWSQVPREERPHRLQFLLNSAHMAGGAGQHTFVTEHADELASVVLELHLEHAANDFAEVDGDLRATGMPTTRWWFTSKLARLEAAVRDAIEAEDLRRSLIVPPTVFGEKPTTDAADFYPAGVPIVNYLTAPFYLFDAMDTLDKIHRPSLVPITRAAVRIVESTRGVSATEMRRG